MQFSTAKTKYVRISPRKARLAAGLIRGLTVDEASSQLHFCTLRGARLLHKTLNTAIANAETQLDAKRSDLKIHEVKVDVGPVWKRAKPRNRGGRAPIMKRTSHFTIILSSE